jgi:hypothetical protein
LEGSNTIDQNGVYGVQGIADSNNIPGAKYCAVSWMDYTGNMWIFGGIGFATGTNAGNMKYMYHQF